MLISSDIVSKVVEAEATRAAETKKKKENRDKNFLDYILRASGFHKLPVAFGMLQDTKNDFGTKIERLQVDGFDLQIFPISSPSDEAYFVCFDMNQIVPGDRVKLIVPASKEGLFVGYGGKRVKWMCRQLDLAKINVVPR